MTVALAAYLILACGLAPIGGAMFAARFAYRDKVARIGACAIFGLIVGVAILKVANDVGQYFWPEIMP